MFSYFHAKRRSPSTRRQRRDEARYRASQNRSFSRKFSTETLEDRMLLSVTTIDPSLDNAAPIYQDVGTPTILDTSAGAKSLTVAVADPVLQSGGIWISREELMSLPTSGKAWDTLVSAAKSSTSSPNVSDQNDMTDVNTLAKALVGVRTGNQQMISDVRTTIMKAIGTEAGGITLALGRNLAPYVDVHAASSR